MMTVIGSGGGYRMIPLHRASGANGGSAAPCGDGKIRRWCPGPAAFDTGMMSGDVAVAERGNRPTAWIKFCDCNDRKLLN